LNKKRPGVITTASGLQYEIVTTGAGVTPTRNDTVVLNYSGKLINGIEFDNSYKRGIPLTIKASDLVAGMTEALMMMTIGSKWKLYIPYHLGYGVNDNNAIPAGSTLLFELELLEIKKPK
jgi:FKBP-type peptidyl-prolyl cis-trans isomerase FklB